MSTGLPDPAVQPFMSAEELVDVLPLGRSAIYAAAKAGTIPGARRVGRRLVFATAELRSWAGLDSTNGNGAHVNDEAALDSGPVQNSGDSPSRVRPSR
jgi:predicted DNA-binding transcriptional regulator AlpA